MEYRLAAEAAQASRAIIEEHHPHLLGVRIEFVFINKTPKSKGKEVWGRAKKISGLPAFLSGGMPEHYEDQPTDFFVVELSEEAWDGLTPKGKGALVDHELCHCDIATDEETGEVKLALRDHDVAEFEAILRRHGLWVRSVEEFVKSGAEQLSLSEVNG
jgi:hypothetical protein